MNVTKFLKFEHVPNEKYIGIVTLNFMGTIILRYKIVATKDGLGYFPAPGSVKGAPIPGKPDHYMPAFTIDSNYLKEEVEEIAMAGFHQWQSEQVAQQASVHQTPWPGQQASNTGMFTGHVAHPQTAQVPIPTHYGPHVNNTWPQQIQQQNNVPYGGIPEFPAQQQPQKTQDEPLPF